MSTPWPETVEVRSAGDRWRVLVNGSQESWHRKKARAVSKAKRKARKLGAKLRIQRANGRWQEAIDYS